jgi:hypothetical protein
MRFAERELVLKRPDGTSESVRVRLFTPEDQQERGWESAVEILGPGDEVSRSHGAGIDAFQALEGALIVLHSMLGRYSLIGELHFCDEPGHGLPFFPRTPEKLDVIAERALVFRPPSGEARDVTVFLGRPHQHGPRRAWFVHINIVDEEKEWRVLDVEGQDSINALIAGLRAIDSCLDWYRERGELTGADDLRQVAAALADGAPTASVATPSAREASLAEVADAGRRLVRAVAKSVRVLASRDGTR